MNEKFSGSTATRAPPARASASRRPAASRFTATSAAEVICSAATLTGSADAVDTKAHTSALAFEHQVGTPAAASRRAVSNSGNPTTPE
jgi:hypothetical protein